MEYRLKGTFHTHKYPHHKGRNIILTGTREKAIGLWKLSLLNNNRQLYRDMEHSINNTYHVTNQTDLVKYFHAKTFGPVKSIWIIEIQKNISNHDLDSQCNLKEVSPN